MADNTTLNTGAGGDTIATDDVTTLNGSASTGVKVQRVKVLFGPDGTATDVADVSGAQLPVTIGARTTYSCTTGPITGATAVGTKVLAYLWHPSAVTLAYALMAVNVNMIAGAGGAQRIELRRITAENATPGGTTGSILPHSTASAASGGTVRIAPTGAPTITTGAFGSANVPTSTSGNAAFPPYLSGQMLEDAQTYLSRGGVAEGFVITQEVTATITTAPTFNVGLTWWEG